MNDRNSEFSNIILRISDFTLLNISMLAMLGIGVLRWGDTYLATFALWDFVASNAIWVFGAVIFSLYNSPWRDTESILRRTFRTLVIHVLLFSIIFLNLFHNYIHIYLYYLAGFYFIFFLFLLVSRFSIIYFVEFVTNKTKFKTKCAIIGKNETGLLLADFFRNNDTLHAFDGFLDDKKMPMQYTESKESVYKFYIEYAANNNITELYTTQSLIPHTETIIDYAENNCIKLKFVNMPDEFYSAGAMPLYLEEYFKASELQIASKRFEPLMSINNRFKKRIFDLVFSSLVIIFIMSWLFPILAILIKLGSKGPIFFKQQRSGRDNKPFNCLKFRSMRVNKDSDTVQATKNDKRVTKLGAFMRKTSIDELPQFFNVFAGDMSIIGPRPHMLNHTEKYKELIDKYLVRQFLKPGISGWAQVNGYRGETKNLIQMQKRVECDIWYMENWSVMLDVKIVFMTVINIVKGEPEAY